MRKKKIKDELIGEVKIIKDFPSPDELVLREETVKVRTHHCMAST